MSLRTELPYRPDSAALFEIIADLPWAVFLDSGGHHLTQSRYDIIAAEPHTTLVTRGKLTEIRSDAIELSREDPLVLLRRHLDIDASSQTDLPFSGGAIGYFSYDLGRRFEQLPALARTTKKCPRWRSASTTGRWSSTISNRRSWLTGQGRCVDTDVQWNELVRAFQRAPASARACRFASRRRWFPVCRATNYAHAFERVLRLHLCRRLLPDQSGAALQRPRAGDPWLAYQALRIINPAPYAAYLNTPYGQVLSASPERFLKLDGRKVETKPIKGTRARGGHPRLDAERAAELRTSEKDRAENVMIVDLLRNDLSKNCEPGSVRVPGLFDVESFATVHHLVSTVTGSLRQGRDALDLLRGSFPGGSITGAPKLRAMQIIEELEPHRRGVYCGAIGYIGYDGNMDLNIAIRTLVYTGG